MKRIEIKPTSRSSAESGDLLLRQTSTTRLVFRPLIVDNPHDPRASVKGELIYQRKSARGNWEDHNELKLSELKAQEWVKLPLKSEEVLELFLHLFDLYKLHSKTGIPRRATRYVQVQEHLAALLEATEEEFVRFLRANEDVGIDLFLRLLSWLAAFGDPARVVERLEKLEIETLEQLNTAVGVSALRKATTTWADNRSNSEEDFWHDFLLENRFVLAQVFANPVLVIRDKAYVGGKAFDNRGGGFIDFLLANQLTRNALLLEIKTPGSPLVKGDYRGIPLPSRELVGSVSQVQHYKQEMMNSFAYVGKHDLDRIAPFYPRCTVLIGDCGSLQGEEEHKAFEVYRNGLRDVDVVTFDELFARVEVVLETLEEGLG